MTTIKLDGVEVNVTSVTFNNGIPLPAQADKSAKVLNVSASIIIAGKEFTSVHKVYEITPEEEKATTLDGIEALGVSKFKAELGV